MKRCRVLNTVLNKFYENRDKFDPLKTGDMEVGNMFEMVIRKYFATSSNGQFFTPREIIGLMMNIMLNSTDISDDLFKDGAVVNVLDMACGTGGMLSIAQETLNKVNNKITVNLFGQEVDPKLYSVCLSDILLKGQDVDNIKCANTLYEDAFPKDEMDFILANPPFGTSWRPSGSKKDNKADNLKEQYLRIKEEESKGEKGKYEAGIASDGTDCQIMFIQHALYKLKESGKACIISNNKPLMAGEVGSGESDIRKWILDKDYIEAIIKLPGQMFYNTGINIYLNIFNKGKAVERKNKILLIDASDEDGKFEFHSIAKRSIGDKRNELTKKHIEKIIKLYTNFKASKFSKVISRDDFINMKFTTKQAMQCDFSINSERLESFKNGKLYNILSHGTKLTEEQINILLRQDEFNENEKSNIEKHNIGIDIFKKIYNALVKNKSDKVYIDIEDFIEFIKASLGYKQVEVQDGEKKDKKGNYKKKKIWVLSECGDITLNGIKSSFLKKSFNDLFKIIAFDLAQHNEEADIITDKDGNILFDDESKDTETIQVSSDLSLNITCKLEKSENEESENIKLTAKKKNLLYGSEWEKEVLESYLEKEVLPYAKNTHVIDKVMYGAKYDFDKQFYVYKPLVKSNELLKKYQEIEKSISSDLNELLEGIK
ncbi:HsdM family class I SAM-dependent methyltransferase [Clostridium senegalense]|uniref:HsdM family class I SAM-dependent methyltransferase n=1 Tax=Clostridium senegalense TaxID=1465809 RepID=UPI0002887C52|nr:N-6 DNA methylase [Clostridium senegalense]